MVCAEGVAPQWSGSARAAAGIASLALVVAGPAAVRGSRWAVCDDGGGDGIAASAMASGGLLPAQR